MREVLLSLIYILFLFLFRIFDYLVETIPVLHWHKLLADGHTEGSLAYWGYRLPIQLPLIWETLQLAVASTILSVMVAIILAFWRRIILKSHHG